MKRAIPVERVENLKTEGKSYNIYYKGKTALNLTLEEGKDMTQVVAANILKDMLKQHKIPTNILIADVTFEEAEPNLD